MNKPQLSRRRLLISALATLALPAWAAPARPRVDVWKDPNCGCCGDWVKHLEAEGFAVRVFATGADAARRRLGLPDAYASCHTALVDGYVLEGHVPADDVKRLLRTKPTALGLSVPGMPVGSPGMEMGPRLDPYDVLLVQRDGSTSVFSHYPKAQPQA